MEKIDLKDRKILYHLDINSRQSFRGIGRKVGLSKDVVAYRVNNLIEKGIIENFKVMINSSRLGYTIFRFYITFQYANPEIKKEIINYFVESKYTNAVVTLEGSYDLLIFLREKNLSHIYLFWEKTLSKYRDYFADHVFAIYYQEQYYDLAFLLDEKPKREIIRKNKLEEPIDIDDLDIKILEILSSNARIPTVEIARELDSSVNTINRRIKNLYDLRIIREFTISIDFPKIGYYIYKVNISLKNYKKYLSIIKYVESIPYFFCIDKSLGYVDLELEFCLKDVNHLKQIMEDIEQKFPNDIRNYTYFKAMKIHKYHIYIS